MAISLQQRSMMSPGLASWTADQFSASVDTVGSAEWDRLLDGFADACVYQSAAYGSARWGHRHLSHLVVRRGDRIAAVAQARILKTPLLPFGVAYVASGPAWCPRDATPDLQSFRWAIRALKQEYAVRRGLFLRVVPNVLMAADHPVLPILREEGLEEYPSSNRTILLDLTPPLDDLRSGLQRRWRRGLNNKDNKGIDWVEGTEASLYDEALRVYREMHERKQFAEFVNKEEFLHMQAQLPEALKMRILIGRLDGAPIAALAWAVFGETGLPLLAATGGKALENDAAYVMWWRMLTWLKEHGFRACDVGGINPERNPGSYAFKFGMARTYGREVRFVGEFGICTHAVNRAAFGMVKWGMARARVWKLRAERLRRQRRVQTPPAGAAPGTAAESLPPTDQGEP